MQHDAREDLAIIRRMMEESGRTVEVGAPHYVVWGLLVTAALVASWGHDTGRLAVDTLWIWTTAIGVGWIASMLLGIRSDRQSGVRTAGGRAIMGIWVGAGVILTMAGFLGIGSGALPEHAMLGLSAAVMGGALFASSFVHRPSPFRGLAFAWWVGAVPLFLWTAPGAKLLLAGMMAGLMLLPGLWMTLGSGGDARRQAAAGGQGHEGGSP